MVTASRVTTGSLYSGAFYLAESDIAAGRGVRRSQEVIAAMVTWADRMELEQLEEIVVVEAYSDAMRGYRDTLLHIPSDAHGRLGSAFARERCGDSECCQGGIIGWS